MIKKILATFAFVTILLSCAGHQPARELDPIPVDVSIQVNDKECIQEEKKAYENGKPTISQLSFIHNNVGYIKIFSGISVADTTRLWNDLTIFKLIGVKDVHVFLNSPGGGAFDGIAIAYHLMKAREDGLHIIVHASGIVASAAVPVLAAGSERFALRGTIFMVHEAALWKWPGRETASDIRSQNELMLLLKEEYLGILDEQTPTDRDAWEDMEGRTTWFNCITAIELGLIDGIE